MKIELKSVKHSAFASQETLCFEAKVYVNGKKAGYARNEGCGGCTSVYWDTPEVREKIEEFCKTLEPMELGSGHTLDYTDDQLIDSLLVNHLDLKDVKRITGKKTIFFLTTDEEGSYRYVKAPYSEEVKNYLTKKYGDKLKQIIHRGNLNEFPLPYPTIAKLTSA